MGFFNIFRKKTTTDLHAADAPDDILIIARAVEKEVEQVINSIFVRFRDHLMSENLTFIVPAVWGASKEGGINGIQQEIFNDFKPAFDRMMQHLDLNSLRPEQEFAVGYIIRSLVVTKIVFMIEAAKRRQEGGEEPDGNDDDSLKYKEPAGRA